MRTRALRRWQRLLLSRAAGWLIPTLSTLYFNHYYLTDEGNQLAIVSDEEWARRERHRLLDRSEARLASIETKGPGLATVCAVVGGGVILAVSGGWDSSTCAGKALLVMTALYVIFSLGMPIYLVGQQPRFTIEETDLAAAARTSSPEAYLAEAAAERAVLNTRRTRRLGNLQDAARADLALAVLVLVLWCLLAPVTGLLEK